MDNPARITYPRGAMLVIALALVSCAAHGCVRVGSSEPVCDVTLTLNAEPTRAAPGEAFTVRGGGFVVGCNDTGEGTPEPPDGDVRVDLRQKERTWRLATLSADEKYVVEGSVTVPPDARPGRATVVASGDSGRAREPFVILSESKR